MIFIGEREKRARRYLVMFMETRDIYIYSILHILTIVFHGTRTVEYQPIFHMVTYLFFACCVVIDYH